MNDAPGTVWFATHFQKHGLFKHPDHHSFHSINDLLGRPPLAPLIFSWILSPMENEYDMTFTQYKKIVFFHSFLSILILSMIFFTLKSLTHSDLAALSGSLLYALDLPSMSLVFYIYTDTIFTFLILVGTISLLFGLHYGNDSQKVWVYALSGTFWGLATLTRVNSLLVFVPVALSVAVAYYFQTKSNQSIVKASTRMDFAKRYGIWILAVCLVVSFRIVQVYLLTGKPFFSLSGLYASHQTAVIMAEVQGKSYAEMDYKYTHENFYHKMRKDGVFVLDIPELIDLNQQAVNNFRSAAIRHPWVFIKIQILHFLRLFHAVGRTQIGDVIGKQPSKLVDVSLVKRPWLVLKPENFKLVITNFRESGLLLVLFVWGHLAVLYLCALLLLVHGFKQLFKRRDSAYVWVFALFVILAYLSIVSSLQQTIVRYRVPLIPLIALLAGWGSSLILDKYKKRA